MRVSDPGERVLKAPVEGGDRGSGHDAQGCRVASTGSSSTSHDDILDEV
jgi:hypothetical protein